VRDALLQAVYVGADGSVVTAGGPTVKNVSGFDVCRLLVGSEGTLGFVGEVILRTRPVALDSRWFTVETTDPEPVFVTVHRPVSMLWDGRRVHVLLEGHPADLDEQVAAAGLSPSDGAPPVPAGRFLVRPAEAVAAASRLDPAVGFVVELGLGVVHTAPEAVPAPAPVPAAVAAVARRVKANFDPQGRFNPGRAVDPVRGS
jgi:FAD/FMN-containing dehydrogenase